MDAIIPPIIAEYANHDSHSTRTRIL
jgi:hypothetical protein